MNEKKVRMMAKYIDANALKGEIQKRVFNSYTDEFWGTMQVIDEAPAIDVDPVRHGERVKLDAHSGMEQYKCSACNNAVYVPECVGEPLYDFCPNCGARMGGGKDE